MTALALLLDLTGRGVEFRFEGDALRWRGKRSVLTPETTAHLKSVLPELKPLVRRAESDPAAFRLEAAAAIFAAEPVDTTANPVDETDKSPVDPWTIDHGTVRCFACVTERNREIPVCTRCHPPAWLPRECFAKRVCSVVGVCDRRAAGRACRIDGQFDHQQQGRVADGDEAKAA